MRSKQTPASSTAPHSSFSSAPRLLRPLVLGMLLLSGSNWSLAAADKASTYYEDGQRRFERGDLPGAIIQLKNSIQEDQKMLAAHLLLGKVLLGQGELKAAEAALEEALKQGVSRSEVAFPWRKSICCWATGKSCSIKSTPAACRPTHRPRS